MASTEGPAQGDAEQGPAPRGAGLPVTVLSAAAAVIAVVGIPGAATLAYDSTEYAVTGSWLFIWLVSCTAGLPAALVCALAAGAGVARVRSHSDSGGAGRALAAGGIVGVAHLTVAWWWTVADLPPSGLAAMNPLTTWGPWSERLAGMSSLEISVFLVRREPAIGLAVALAFAAFLLTALLGLALYRAGPRTPTGFWPVCALALVLPAGVAILDEGLSGIGSSLLGLVTTALMASGPPPIGLVVLGCTGVYAVRRFAGRGAAGKAAVVVLLIAGGAWHLLAAQGLAGLTGG